MDLLLHALQEVESIVAGPESTATRGYCSTGTESGVGSNVKMVADCGSGSSRRGVVGCFEGWSDQEYRR